MTRAAPRLDPALLPSRLWEKAKVHGAWNPADLDFRTDRGQWLALPEPLRVVLRRLSALFLAGEEAVTRNLPPLLHVVAAEGRLEEALYLTSFLWEEAKHVDLFNRFFAEVCEESPPSQDDDPIYRRLFDDELRTALERLLVDRSPDAQVRAAVTYHLVVEGVLAETGYYIFQRVVRDADTLPAMQRGIGFLHRDESRHLAFGIYFLCRLVIEHGDRAYKTLLDRMMELKPVTEAVTERFVGSLHEAAVHVRVDELVRFSQQHFSARIQRIIRARTQRLDELHASREFEADAAWA